jgi:hypothetical protein
MDPDVPYLVSIGNLTKILDQIQRAGVPEVFNRDFLKDLGFSASQDRPMVKILKYLGMLDSSGRPQTPYREFVDHTKAKKVLAARLRAAFDDLFLADRQANTKSAEALKGWFKTKTGAGDAVAQKMATTFKALAQYADFSSQVDTRDEAAPPPTQTVPTSPAGPKPAETPAPPASGAAPPPPPAAASLGREIGFVYRIEIHLPDTQNVDTFRAIFRALREELVT